MERFPEERETIGLAVEKISELRGGLRKVSN